HRRCWHAGRRALRQRAADRIQVRGWKLDRAPSGRDRHSVYGGSDLPAERPDGSCASGCRAHVVAGDEVMTTPVLEIRVLSIRFGGLRAVDHVSFCVARNRITTVIGPNGAGKSTLFNLISGAMKPHAGQVLVESRDYTGAPPYRL